MASITVHSPHSQSNRAYRHAPPPTGHTRYRCPTCGMKIKRHLIDRKTPP
ncbi:IS1 family transposase [Aeromonas sp. 55A]